MRRQESYTLVSKVAEDLCKLMSDLTLSARKEEYLTVELKPCSIQLNEAHVVASESMFRVPQTFHGRLPIKFTIPTQPFHCFLKTIEPIEISSLMIRVVKGAVIFTFLNARRAHLKKFEISPRMIQALPQDIKDVHNSKRLSAQEAEKLLATAKVKEILGCDSRHKSLFLLLSDESGNNAVLLLNKTSFVEDPTSNEGLIKQLSLKEVTRNDVFCNYEIQAPANLNVLSSQLIFPASDKLIAKYRTEDKIVITETPEDYKNITLPYIEKFQNTLQWVYNVLEKKKEADKIIFEDPDKVNGFIIAPDMKWDGETLETLYCLAIIHRHGVRSIRDLTHNDIPMLENIREKGKRIIKEKYGLEENKLRIYFHYQPSFYHLHVHFVSLKYDAAGQTILSAIPLDDVINNLKLLPDYYQKTDISFARKKTDPLAAMFEEHKAQGSQ